MSDHLVPATKLWPTGGEFVIVLECDCGVAVDYPGHPDERSRVTCERCGSTWSLTNAPPIDDRFSDAPLHDAGVAGLAVALKALALRAGGSLSITEAELTAAAGVLAQVDATPEQLSIQVVPGQPPPYPVMAKEQP